MAAAISDGIDHFVCAVEDLEQAAATYARLGFALTPRGDHSRFGSHNRCIVLADHYLELFSFYDPGRFPEHPLLPVVRRSGEGIIGAAFGSDVADDAPGRFLERGYERLYPAMHQSRNMSLPDGRRLEMKVATAMLPAAGNALFFAFLCQHFTREVTWDPLWQQHANAVHGLVRATALVEQAALDREVAWLADALELSLERQEGMNSILTPRGELRFATRSRLADLYPLEVLGHTRSPPYILALTLSSRDLTATARLFDGSAVSFVDESCRLLVGPAAAHGVLLEIVPV